MHWQGQSREIMADNSKVDSGTVRLGLLITTVGGLLFTLDLPLLRLAASDMWTLVFARGLFQFIAITAVWYIMRSFNGSKAPYIAGAAGLAVVATNTLAPITYIGAIVETSAANVVFITALIPVITAMLSRIFLGEQVHGWTWVATLVAFAGAGIIVWDGVSAGKVFGDVLALVSASCTAGAFTIIRASKKNVATSLAVGSLASALIAIAIFDASPASLAAPASFGVSGWIWVALNGLVAIPIASTLIANGPRFLPPADVSMFFLLETVLTPIWIWLIFAEAPTQTVLIGGTIVILTLAAHSVWRLQTTLRGSGETASASADS
jgi:drug/metabolite transporter (DMT)-like permease